MAIGLAALLGLCIGSFLNVVIYRLPRIMEQEWREQCAEVCGDSASTAETRLGLARLLADWLGWWAGLGLAGVGMLISYFLILKGKCSACGKPISLRYPLVELFTALASAFVVWHFGPSAQAAGALMLVWALIALTAIDIDTQLLPDAITLPLLWLGLLLNLQGTYTDLSSAVIGAMAGYLVLWSVFWLFKLATGKDGMGYGDFKLLGALGAWLGWQMLPAIILLSSVVGAIVGIALIAAARHGRNVPIPFGPYLAAAGVIALVWGKTLTNSYLGLVY